MFLTKKSLIIHAQRQAKRHIEALKKELLLEVEKIVENEPLPLEFQDSESIGVFRMAYKKVLAKKLDIWTEPIINRFKDVDFPVTKIEVEYIGTEKNGPCYRSEEKKMQIIFNKFDVLLDLVVHHYPDAKNNTCDNFSINNIEVQTDEKKLKLTQDEFDTIYKKVKDSIEFKLNPF